MSSVHKKTKHSTDCINLVDECVVKNKNEDLGKKVAFESKTENMPHACPICDYSCTTKSSLKMHCDAVHEGKKPYKCTICDYSSARRTKLKIHIDAVHEGKKPHKCLICDYSCVVQQRIN